MTVPAGGQMPIAVQSNFSPTGVVALSSSLAINPAAVLTAQDTTVTVRVSNPNEAAQEITSATATLPAGVEYVAGSAAGIGEPVITDDQVAFNCSFAEIEADDALEFTFRVRATTAGTYNITLAAGVASLVEVTPSSAEPPSVRVSLRQASRWIQLP